jgi:UDP-4-amino-4,6-dideoxy-N-acetyl-beta-L-altrosamine transaminase
MDEFIPFAQHTIEQEEIDEVVDTLKSKWITTGPKAKLFEQQFAEYLGAKHALAVNSCTAALHLALEAINIKPNDKVITTPFTFTATAETIRYLGAEPLFVDINEKTLNIDPGRILDTLQDKNTDTSSVKAILPVHIGGLACDMNPIIHMADTFELKVIEDAAHALPTKYKGRLIGTIGDVTCFSFYATKTITTGEGGMLVTDNDQLAHRIKTMRLHGISRDVFDRYTALDADWYYEVVAPGFKYNMPDIAAAIGIQQLKKVEKFCEKRAQIAYLYHNEFKNLPELDIPDIPMDSDQHSWHLYIIKLKLDQLNISRNEFINQMKSQGIGTSVHFIPIHIQPYYRDRYNFKEDDFPVSYNLFKRVVSLPIYPKMTGENVRQVVRAIKNIIVKNKKSTTVGKYESTPV